MAIPTRILRHLAIGLVVLGAGALLVGDRMGSAEAERVVLVVSVVALVGAIGCAVALARQDRRSAG